MRFPAHIHHTRRLKRRISWRFRVGLPIDFLAPIHSPPFDNVAALLFPVLSWLHHLFPQASIHTAMGIRNLLFRRQRQVEEQLGAYMDHWWECIDCFSRGMDTYLKEGPGEQFDYYYRRVDQEESKGDELRRAIGRELFGKALLPESRGDIMRVLESLDQVMNRSESVVRMAVIQRITLEEWMVPGIRRLVDGIVDACRLLREAAGHLLRGSDDPVGDLAHEVQELESRCDHVELDLVEQVFASNLELARKLQYKDFLLRLGSVADLAEAASDRMYVVSVKRRV